MSMSAATPPRARQSYLDTRLETPSPGPTAGPSTPGRLGAPSGSGSGGREGAPAVPDLWTDILRSADRQKALARKNVLLLSERHRGRAHLLDKIVGRRSRRPDALAIGYELLHTDDRDEGAFAASLLCQAIHFDYSREKLSWAVSIPIFTSSCAFPPEAWLHSSITVVDHARRLPHPDSQCRR